MVEPVLKLTNLIRSGKPIAANPTPSIYVSLAQDVIRQTDKPTPCKWYSKVHWRFFLTPNRNLSAGKTVYLHISITPGIPV